MLLAQTRGDELEKQLNQLRRAKKRLVGLHYLGHAKVDKEVGPHLCWEDKNSELERIPVTALSKM